MQQEMGQQSSGGTQPPSAMTDQDWATDVLILEKHLCVSYSTALNEASTQPLFNVISTICGETQKSQHQLFEFMKQQGWYKPTQETPATLQQNAQKAKTDMAQLPVH